VPTAAEATYNKALNGDEVKRLIQRDVDRLLSNFGEINSYVAYSKVGWRVVVTLQTGNAFRPEVSSDIEGGDELPIEDAVTSAHEIEHQVESPNVERVHAGIPIPVKVKELDGTTVEKRITYASKDVNDLPPEKVTITDVTPRETEVIKKRGRPRKNP